MRTRRMNKKGQTFDALGALTIGLVTLGIILIVAFLILAELKDNAQVAAEKNATAAVKTVTSTAEDIPNWLPIITIVFVGAILIGMIAMFRRGR